ncbi:MAG TPA: nitrile hydratase accessory protein [Nevskiaceae bacterium]|nr:nitrile hydratase accessory protein [Nevskiaceae bacterium]
MTHDPMPPAVLDPARLMAIPREADDGVVFREPWQAQAFALTVQLNRRGVFTWKEWTLALGAEIAAAKARGELDLGQDYFRYWLTALEGMLVRKGLTDTVGLAALRETTRSDWPTGADHVARRAPLVVG